MVLGPTQILVGSGNPLLPGSSGGPRSGSPGSTYLVPGDVRPSFLGQVPVYLSDCPFSGNITTKMLMNLFHFPWAKTHQHISLKKESRCFKKEASESKCLISVNALVWYSRSIAWIHTEGPIPGWRLQEHGWKQTWDRTECDNHPPQGSSGRALNFARVGLQKEKEQNSVTGNWECGMSDHVHSHLPGAAERIGREPRWENNLLLKF